MTRRVSICVVGSINVDLTFRTARLPRPGETLAGSAFQMGHGGKGANQAVMAARLGAAVSMVGRVGADAFGREAVTHLQAEGLDTRHVLVSTETATGVAGIVVDDEAQNCILVVPGANALLSAQDVRQAAPAIAGTAALLCQLEVPLEATHEALRVAREAGVRTILNPAPAQVLSRELLERADLCVPNETELEILTGKPSASLEDIVAAARELQQRGARTVLVTLGARGALLLDGAEPVHVPAFAVDAVDPTAAGDAFIGSLAVFWSAGMALADTVRRANAVAALTATRPGAQSALPNSAEVDAFLASAT